MTWNDDWREELKKDKPDVYERLCDCRNLRRDIPVIAKLMRQYNPGMDKRDCLDRTLEWITDWNSQVNLYPDEEEYEELLNLLK